MYSPDSLTKLRKENPLPYDVLVAWNEAQIEYSRFIAQHSDVKTQDNAEAFPERSEHSVNR